MNAVAGRSPMHVGGLGDDELVQLARGGHEQAFDAIVHRYRGPLVSYCRRWLDAHRAEEVVQHTLLKAYVCLRDDERPLVLRPWLYRVAHNAALNALEKKGSDWEELDENYDGVPQPPQVAEQRARFLKVVDEIGALPLRQREALLLNEFEGRCYADIAAELGTSESGVRGLLRRARRQLRETAAALLLPFPVLRELVRSDAGRLQVDRAGELAGSAGAAGAAGGFAKVAAGVLAAGTIAGGGTAIQQNSGGWRSPGADVAEVAAPQRAVRESTNSTLVAVAVAGDERDALPGSSLALSGGELVRRGGLSSGSYGDGSFGGIEEHPQEQDEAGQFAPSPFVLAEPPVAAPTEPENEPADEDAAGELMPPNDSSSTDSAGGTEQGAGHDGATTEEPQGAPATPASPLPQRL